MGNTPRGIHLSLSSMLSAVATGDRENVRDISFLTLSNEKTLYVIACLLWCCGPLTCYFSAGKLHTYIQCKMYIFLNIVFHHFAGAVLSIATFVLLLFYVVWIKENVHAINCYIQPQMWFQGPVRFVICTQACPEASLYAATLSDKHLQGLAASSLSFKLAYYLVRDYF